MKLRKWCFGIVVILSVSLISAPAPVTAKTISGKITKYQAADGTDLSKELKNAYDAVKTLSQKSADYDQADLHELTLNLRKALAALALIVSAQDTYKTTVTAQDLEL